MVCQFADCAENPIAGGEKSDELHRSQGPVFREIVE
jgi:hypothetical protein